MLEGASFTALAEAMVHGQTWFLVVVILIAGVVRGFSGFGGALIFIPLASAVIGPKLAVPIFYLVDLVTATPYGLRQIRHASFREVAPTLGGSWLAAPFGVWLLATLEADILRWATAVTVVFMLVILASGWRYKGETRPPISFGVGLIGGALGSSTGISGPVIIAYWLGSRAGAAQVRSNIMAFYALAALGTDLVFLWRGLFTGQTLFYAVLAAPLYALGLWVGARYFKGTSDLVYRRAAFALIALSTLVSLPPVTAFLQKLG